VIAALLLCAAAHVVDGDTIRCSGVGRVRLASIDAPDKEHSSVCLRHIGDHVCSDYQAASATLNLLSLTNGKRVTFRAVGHDFRNNRVVALMYVSRTDLQCAQLRFRDSLTHRLVVRYQATYDKRYGFPVLHRCRATVKAAAR
jgi:endonuclease YncB( thermonuclease family)